MFFLGHGVEMIVLLLFNVFFKILLK